MDFDAGYLSFDTSSSWSSPPSSTSESSFHIESTQQHDFDMIHTCSHMHCDNAVHMLDSDSTNDVGSWMQQSPASRDAQCTPTLPLSVLRFGHNDVAKAGGSFLLSAALLLYEMIVLTDMVAVNPNSFNQDFVLYDSQDSTVSTDWQQDVTQYAQLHNQSLAAVEARILLTPSITISRPVSEESKPSSRRRAPKHTAHTSVTANAPSTRSMPLPQGRRRTERPRLPCSTAGCQKTFTRASDLDRHLRVIHSQGTEYYECSSHRCLYRTRRKDKMQEHCQKVHAHGRGAESYTVVPDGDAYTPGSSAASTPTSTTSDN